MLLPYLAVDQFSLHPTLFQDVALAPLGHVDGEHVFINQAAAEIYPFIWMRQLTLNRDTSSSHISAGT